MNETMQPLPNAECHWALEKKENPNRATTQMNLETCLVKEASHKRANTILLRGVFLFLVVGGMGSRVLHVLG